MPASVFQGKTNRFPKDGLSHCKRSPFSLQKVVFYRAKDGLLQRIEIQTVTKAKRNHPVKSGKTDAANIIFVGKKAYLCIINKVEKVKK